MDQDTSVRLVAQSYGGSTHEALGSVAAPQVNDEHHDKVKTQQKHSNPINGRGKKEDEEPDYIHHSFQDAYMIKSWECNNNASVVLQLHVMHESCSNDYA